MITTFSLWRYDSLFQKARNIVIIYGILERRLKNVDSIRRFQADFDKLPAQFPTHLHPAEFWEALGRVVATFGFLEETLGKAIFSFTATRQYPEAEIQAAYEKWLPTLQRALSAQLGGLIDSYGKAVRENPKATISNLDDLIDHLRKASTIRNVLCHGSWNHRPDNQGQSPPFFVNKNNELFETPVDLAYLNQVQQHVAELACNVINTVMLMGYQFPGSNGPGKSIWPRRQGERSTNRDAGS